MGKIFMGVHMLTGYSVKHGIHPEYKINILGNCNADTLKSYKDYKGVHLIRDPRDVLISGYYSHLKTHSTAAWPELEEYRQKLKTVPFEEGLMMEMDFNAGYFEDMMSWDYNNPNVIELRFEDIPRIDFEDVFSFLGLSATDSRSVDFWFHFWRVVNFLHLKKMSPIKNYNMKTPISKLLWIVHVNSYARLSGGRTPGEENKDSHYRSGVSGEWKDVLTEEHKKAFKEKFPGLLEKLGYETSADW